MTVYRLAISLGFASSQMLLRGLQLSTRSLKLSRWLLEQREAEQKCGNGWVTEGKESRCITEEKKLEDTRARESHRREQKGSPEGSWENQVKSKVG